MTPRRKTSGPSSKPSRRWATRRARCRARSAPPSGWSATTAGWTVRGSGRCRASQEVIHVSKPYKQVSREWKAETPSCALPGGSRSAATTSWSWPAPAPSKARRRSSPPRTPSRPPAPRCCAAARSSRARSPYSFQGLGRKGLELLAQARAETGLLIVTEAMDPEGAELVAEVADIIQIGARNMQNYSLLKAVGRSGKPVLLKRGMAATIHELLLSAEYVLAEGNPNVILCERGHPQLRHPDPQPVRPHRDPGRARAVAPADHRRSEPRHRAARQGAADGARRRRRRRRRHHGRSAPAARPRAVRRRAEALPRAVRRMMRRAARDRRGDRPADRRTGGLAGMRLRAFALLALLPLLHAPAVRAQDAAAVLQRTADAYRRLHSLAANFDQIVSSEMIGTFTSRGTLAQSGASRLAMRFSDPKNEAIVIDGTYIWIYTPSTAPGQVLRMPIARASAYGVNLLGWLLDRPGERYHASFVRQDTVGTTPVDVLHLCRPSTGFRSRRPPLWLARSDALPRRIEVTEPSGNHRTLTLSHLRRTPCCRPMPSSSRPRRASKSSTADPRLQHAFHRIGRLGGQAARARERQGLTPERAVQLSVGGGKRGEVCLHGADIPAANRPGQRRHRPQSIEIVGGAVKERQIESRRPRRTGCRPPRQVESPCPRAPPSSSRRAWRRRGRPPWRLRESGRRSFRAAQRFARRPQSPLGRPRRRRTHPGSARRRWSGRPPSAADGMIRGWLRSASARRAPIGRRSPDRWSTAWVRPMAPSRWSRDATTPMAASGTATSTTSDAAHASAQWSARTASGAGTGFSDAPQQRHRRPGTRKGQGNALAHPARADDGDARCHDASAWPERAVRRPPAREAPAASWPSPAARSPSGAVGRRRRGGGTPPGVRRRTGRWRTPAGR